MKLTKGYIMNYDGDSIWGQYWFREGTNSFHLQSKLDGTNHGGYTEEGILQYAADHDLQVVEESVYRTW